MEDRTSWRCIMAERDKDGPWGDPRKVYNIYAGARTDRFLIIECGRVSGGRHWREPMFRADVFDVKYSVDACRRYIKDKWGRAVLLLLLLHRTRYAPFPRVICPTKLTIKTANFARQQAAACPFFVFAFCVPAARR